MFSSRIDGCIDFDLPIFSVACASPREGVKLVSVGEKFGGLVDMIEDVLR